MPWHPKIGMKTLSVDGVLGDDVITIDISIVTHAPDDMHILTNPY